MSSEHTLCYTIFFTLVVLCTVILTAQTDLDLRSIIFPSKNNKLPTFCDITQV